MLKKALLAASSALALTACMSGTGPALKSSVTQGVAGVEARLPYANYTNYFGYVDASVKPEGKYKNKDAYYLYAWVPAAVDEIGVSMVSPATSTPSDSDFVNVNYTNNFENDSKTYFDTYIVLDRMDIIDPAKIKNGGKSLQTLTYNDDSSELPQNPGGQSYNSLLRQTSDINNPTKALVRGVYRISFTSFRSAVEGSFEATVGTNVPGVKIAASLDELHNLVNEG
ncbi:MAG: LipL32 family surface lipoprotein [Pseudomonadota bacterium]|uniref:LipL32 family surface lipoprotein n=1 Tax=Pseudoalteromonas sp. XMcav1-K TaxID=3374372 RepID=UPI002EA81867|nr:LipL32 family surface lipoprotein [Pseudomonadota bacterium]